MNEWTTAILGGDANRMLLLGGLSMIRLVPVVFLVPFLGGRLVPAPAKLGLVLGLTVVLSPVLAIDGGQDFLTWNAGQVCCLALKEVLVGMAIGFLTALVFYAVQAAGSLIDTVRGQTLATALLPAMPDRVSHTSAFGVQLLIVAFLALDGHHLLLEGLAESFRLVPVTAFPPAHLGLQGLFTAAVQLTGEFFAIALALSLPVIAATLLVDMALGVLNRAAPQIHVFFLGMPLKALLGVLMVLAALTAMADLMIGRLAGSARWIRWLIQLLQP